MHKYDTQRLAPKVVTEMDVGGVNFWWDPNTGSTKPRRNLYSSIRCRGCGEQFGRRDPMPADGNLRSDYLYAIASEMRAAVNACKACNSEGVK